MEDVKHFPVPISQSRSANPDGFEVTRASASNSIDKLSNQVGNLQKLLGAIEIFSKISNTTGNSVHLLEEYNFFPVLIGNDRKPVPLFNLMEILDELVDYDAVIKELPTISYTQVHNAINFLRKVSAINLHGEDIDDIEEDIDNSDALLNALKSGFEDKEITRVLYRDEQNRE
jgi:hypothetical protein